VQRHQQVDAISHLLCMLLFLFVVADVSMSISPLFAASLTHANTCQFILVDCCCYLLHPPSLRWCMSLPSGWRTTRMRPWCWR
jgi:hypothetical protein